MNLNKPSVIFKVLRYNKASLNNKSKKSRDHYYKNGDWLNYIMRPDAVFNLNITDDKIIELNDLRKGNKSQKSEYNKRLESLNSNFKSTGLYGKNGEMNHDEVKRLKKRMKNLDDNQIFWDTVVSFSEKFIEEEKVFTPHKIYQAIKEEIDYFFNENGLNPKKMNWFFSMHNNTENNHIHLGFFEEEKSDYEYVLDKNNNKILNKNKRPIFKSVWHKTGNLKQGKALFKANIEFNIKKQSLNNEKFFNSQKSIRLAFGEKMENWNIAKLGNCSWNDARQIFVDLNKSKTNIIDKIAIITDQLKEKLILNFEQFKHIPFKKITYGSKFLSDFDRKKLDEITLDFIKNDYVLKKEYDSFVEENNKRAEQFGTIYAKYELNEMDIEEREFALTINDLLKDEDEWDLKNPIERIKYQKLKYKDQHIKSKNKNGFYQGLLPEFGNKILKKIMLNWKKEEYNKKKGKGGVTSNVFNPDGYKPKKKFLSTLLYLPNSLMYMLQKEQKKANRITKNIDKEIKYQKERLRREMR